MLAKVNEATRQLEIARRAQDWLDAQSHSLELARLYRQLQLEEKSEQQLADPNSFRAWLKNVRQQIA